MTLPVITLIHVTESGLGGVNGDKIDGFSIGAVFSLIDRDMASTGGNIAAP